jgi:hypothetical protein
MGSFILEARVGSPNGSFTIKKLTIFYCKVLASPNSLEEYRQILSMDSGMTSILRGLA